jgi:hypothetical protein
MRIQNEQSGSSSLFAQPMAIEPIPETRGITEQGSEARESDAMQGELATEDSTAPRIATVAKLPRGLLESRLEAALATLAEPSQPPSATVRQGHLALLKRWYYRPEVRRTGEIFFPDPESNWPIKPILRGIGRVAAKTLVPVPRA